MSTAFLASLAAATVVFAAGLSPSELRGRELYRKGRANGQAVTVVFGDGNVEMPAESFPCANCHGRRGGGSREGGLRAPSLLWQHLISPAVSELTGDRRPGYDKNSAALAIRSGINPAGAHLHPGMPHYRLTADQMRDLLSYLRALGTDRDWDPGISEKSIRLGAALPLSGPLRAVGEDIQQMLRAYFARVNSQQGIYGRALELVVRDSRGEPTATLEAVRRLVQDDQVFALAGSFEPAGSLEANEFLRQAETPVVCPSTLSPRIPTPPNPWVFYLLPGFADQARALVDFAASRSAGAPIRIAAVASENPF
ncbi:MAG TPA: ABC transporter substrate-binding protein, partial [Candidatus Solibacter sp.]|nr:ABC transporter substrate-binding protein [Candidatus Solibacter sp.]